MSTTEIENLLRRAPQPKPPGNLQQRLKAQALSGPRRVSQQRPSVASSPPGSWFARWWPALAPTVVSVACAAGLTVQRLEINRLRAEMAKHPKTAEVNSANALAGSEKSGVSSTSSASEQEELVRLKDLAATLSADVSRLEQLRAQNDKLRSQLASGSAGVFSAEEIDALQAAGDRAARIQCVNNLKQLGLAVRVWALDNANMTPSNFLSMSNEMGSFSILVCPSDTGRQPAKDASSFTPANCSYEYLAPSSPDSEPDRILFRCPIHGHVCMCDGSVQSGISKEHPDWIVQQDGKYFLRRIEPPAETNNAAPARPGQSH